MHKILRLIRENTYLGYKFNLDFFVQDENNIGNGINNKVTLKFKGSNFLKQLG